MDTATIEREAPSLRVSVAPLPRTSSEPEASPAATASLTISSKNYSAWCLRAWLMCRLSGLDFEEVRVPFDQQRAGTELMLLAPSFEAPRLIHGPVEAWGALAIGMYLDRAFPRVGLLPADPAAFAHACSINGEMQSGFSNLRAAMPVNITARHSGWPIWSGAMDDLERIAEIWHECLLRYGGPYLFGGTMTMSDAMFAPVCTRLRTYDVNLGPTLEPYVARILAHPLLQEWCADAAAEPDDTAADIDIEF